MTRMNLELIETDDLINELMRRFTHGVFAGIKEKLNDDPDGSGETIRYCGKRLANIGLCYRLQFHINQKIEETYEPLDKGERDDG